MLDKIKSIWDRLKVRWSVIALAFLAALPDILNYLGAVDLKPILTTIGVPEGTTGVIVGLLPFVLIFAKSAVHLEPKDTEDKP